VVPAGAGGRLAVIGFSQGTAMAYRTAARTGRPVDAVVALGGDVPPELADLAELPFDRVLIARGVEEEWYAAEKLAADVKLIERLGVEPEVFEYAGGHEWTDAFRARAARFLLESR
jgi:predicted esterase